MFYSSAFCDGVTVSHPGKGQDNLRGVAHVFRLRCLVLIIFSLGRMFFLLVA